MAHALVMTAFHSDAMVLMMAKHQVERGTTVNVTGAFARDEAFIPQLRRFMRHAHYEHRVRYPFLKASLERGMLLPCPEAIEWLDDASTNGEIAGWDSCLSYDLDLHVIVSFMNMDDAILFKLRWC